jgi:ethanolamine utilization protein EutA
MIHLRLMGGSAIAFNLPDTDHGHEHDGGAVSHAHVTSVGIDIGSSTSHLTFSELTIGYPSPTQRRPEVLERRVRSRSPILLTPFAADWNIDVEPLRKLVFGAFADAGLAPATIDTGAVIVTGEAARRDNAARVAQIFADEAGRFVCATAGPRLEGVLAAHGSGAVQLSREDRTTLLHIDIGGGTTKLNVVQRGQVIATTAMNIGARLVAYDDAGRIVRMERAGREFIELLGSPLQKGSALDAATRTGLAHRMAEALFRVLEGKPAPWDGFWVLPPIEIPVATDGVVFSGGVSEYIYGREPRSFGDLGPELGAAVRSRTEERGLAVVGGSEGIRATVIGASSYSMQLSGETIFLPQADVLPIRNLRICVVPVTWQSPVAERSENAVRTVLTDRDPEVIGTPYALAMASPPFIGYGAAQELGDGLRRALLAQPAMDRPSMLVFEQNIGQVIGRMLEAELGIPCIDEVKLTELDFIDIGSPIPGESYVPVVVKSLAFAV